VFSVFSIPAALPQSTDTHVWLIGDFELAVKARNKEDVGIKLDKWIFLCIFLFLPVISFECS